MMALTQERLWRIIERLRLADAFTGILRDCRKVRGYGLSMRTIPTSEPWVRADAFFLEDALRRGMSVEEVSGFLGRAVDEVRAKARELLRAPERSRGRHRPDAAD